MTQKNGEKMAKADQAKLRGDVKAFG